MVSWSEQILGLGSFLQGVLEGQILGPGSFLQGVLEWAVLVVMLTGHWSGVTGTQFQLSYILLNRFGFRLLCLVLSLIRMTWSAVFSLK